MTLENKHAKVVVVAPWKNMKFEGKNLKIRIKLKLMFLRRQLLMSAPENFWKSKPVFRI